MWVASTGLTHLVDKASVPAAFPALHGARVRNVFRAQDGALWIGTDGRGIFRLGPGNQAEQFTRANGLVNNFIRGILQSRRGDLWIATDEGVSRWSHGTFQNFTVQDGLVYFSVRAMLEDQNGDLWIGTDHGLSHLSGDHFVQDAATRALEGEQALANRTPSSDLSPREREILVRIAQGKSNREIAAELDLAEITVKCRVSAILERLDVRDRTEAVVSALQRGLLHL